MAAADDIKSHLDLGQIAQYLGTDRVTAEGVVDDALNRLMGAMDRNVSRPEGAVSLGRALGRHLDGGAYGPQVDISRVDATDGEKIVRHVFSDHQIQTLGSGEGSGLLERLLPILAPIVMGYLASKLQEQMGDALGGGRTAPQTPQAPQGTGGGLGDILGDLLDGAFGGEATPSAPTPAGSRPAQQPSGGGFSTPGVQPTGLRIPGSTEQAPAAPTQGRVPAGGGEDLLGSILSDLLRGGR